MKRLFASFGKKIKGRSGDSLAEVLIALLISAVALVMLASMITSSTSMIDSSKKKMNSYYDAAGSLAELSGSGVNGTVTITGGGLSESFSVDIFTDNELKSPVAAYKLK